MFDRPALPPGAATDEKALSKAADILRQAGHVGAAVQRPSHAESGTAAELSQPVMLGRTLGTTRMCYAAQVLALLLDGDMMYRREGEAITCCALQKAALLCA